ERVAADLVAELAAPAADAGERVAHRAGRRWLEVFEPVRIPAATAPPLPDGAVCLITGGVGGIGLAVARRLARQVPGVRLVLTGRSPLPEPEAWDAWVEERGAADPVSRKIRELRELEAAGAEVLAAAVDVADRAAMRQLVARVERRFGAVTALVHSAGVPGGGMVQRRSAAEVAAVLAPKVAGLGDLEEVLDFARLDLAMLCSSLAAVVGGFGQVDYCSANAYLDARAHQLARRYPSLRVVSVGWDAWREVGMAARALPQGLKALRRGAGARAVAAPLVERCLFETEDWASYRTRFALDAQWAVAEHTIAGQHLLPGTAYLDMAATVAADHGGLATVELADVAFQTPCIVGDGGREVAIDLHREAEGWRVTVSSEVADGREEHARAEVRTVSSPAAAALDLDAVRARCDERVIEVASDGSYRRHGPRWRCLETVHVGQGEWLARLAVPPAFADEVTEHRLHPAVLDVATSFPVRLVTDGDYLPLGYDRLRLVAPLTPRLFSHVRLREGGRDAAALRFDVTLADDAGRPLVEIEGFTIRRIDGIGERLAPPAPPAAAAEAPGDGIAPEEGAEVFARLAAAATVPHLLVSVDDLASVIAEYRGFDLTKLTAAAERLRPAAPARQGSREDFVAPAGAVERQVATIFSELLGIEGVGAQDDFFALGGHSLLGIQLSARLRERFRVELPVDLIFDNPRVGALAAAVEAALAKGETAEDDAPIAAAACRDDEGAVEALSEAELDAALLDLLGEDGLEEASGTT
ncbi:MAG TPA: SDR family NAD(P)-dependent oxidoreductase, partial [Thermoanaerobaculia bacterium]